MSSLVVSLGAWAFSGYEGWSYLDSVYYCVITLTTVGFGDFVALQSPQQRQPDYIAFSIFFILVGLAVVSAAMNLLILRLLTMNTADERRDESLAAIRRSIVKLDAGSRLLNVNGSAISPPLPPRPSNVSTEFVQSPPFSSLIDDDVLETRSSPTPSTVCRSDCPSSTLSQLCCFCRHRRHRWNGGVDMRRARWPSTSSSPPDVFQSSTLRSAAATVPHRRCRASAVSAAAEGTVGTAASTCVELGGRQRFPVLDVSATGSLGRRRPS